MKKYVYCGIVLVLALTICGSLFVNNSMSSTTYPISDFGSYYIPGGMSIDLQGIVCSSLTDYTSSFPVTTMVTDCGSASINIPVDSKNYLVVLEDNGTCSGLQVGSPTRKDANCSLYEYTSGSATVSCSKNNINAGESISCTLKAVTSSSGLDKISFEVNSSDLSVENFSSNFFTVIASNNLYTFAAKSSLKTETQYLVASFDIKNNGIADGTSNDISFNNISFTDSLTMLNLGSTTVSFTEEKEGNVSVATTKATTKKTTKKTTTTSSSNPVSESTTVAEASTKVAETTDAVISPVVDSSPKTGEEEMIDDSDPSLSGTSAIMLTVFVATMSIASGLGIVVLSKHFVK